MCSDRWWQTVFGVPQREIHRLRQFILQRADLWLMRKREAVSKTKKYGLVKTFCQAPEMRKCFQCAFQFLNASSAHTSVTAAERHYAS